MFPYCLHTPFAGELSAFSRKKALCPVGHLRGPGTYRQEIHGYLYLRTLPNFLPNNDFGTFRTTWKNSVDEKNEDASIGSDGGCFIRSVRRLTGAGTDGLRGLRGAPRFKAAEFKEHYFSGAEARPSRRPALQTVGHCFRYSHWRVATRPPLRTEAGSHCAGVARPKNQGAYCRARCCLLSMNA